MNTVDIRLYVILDPAVAGHRLLPAIAAEAARGGATLFQYRDKNSSFETKVETLRAIRTALAGQNTPLLVNDDVEAALAAGAQGVHLGQDDMSPAEARAKLGERAIIGRTVKNAAHAMKLADEPVDYAFCGGVFATTHKINPDAPIGLSGLADLCRKIRGIEPMMPVGAIAGINVGNVQSVIAAGADGVAVIGAVTGSGTPQESARALRSLVDGALALRNGRAS